MIDFPNSPTVGQIFSSPSGTFQWDGTKWAPITGTSTVVSSWNTRTGGVTLTTADITGAGGAPLASPTFTGTPAGPTATAGTNTTQLATTAFVANAVTGGVIRSYLAGLTLSTTLSSATFTVAAGVAADTANAVMMTIAGSFNKTTSAWTAGNSNGGLDTGTIAANTWYHVFLIRRPDTSVVDVLFSLSVFAPTLPANYSQVRRIGSMLTNASLQWTLFHQLGDEFLWDVPVQDVSTSTLGTTATVSALSVPPGVQVRARIRGLASNATAGTTALVTSPDESVQVANTPAGNDTVVTAVAGGSGGAVFALDVRTNTSAQIRYVASAASTTLRVTTYGWYDRRGQDG